MRGGVPLWTQTELIPSVKREENIEREQQRLWKTKPLSSLLWWKFQSACHYSDTHTVCAVSWWYAISASFILIACTPGNLRSVNGLMILTLIICVIVKPLLTSTKVKLDQWIHISPHRHMWNQRVNIQSSPAAKESLSATHPDLKWATV